MKISWPQVTLILGALAVVGALALAKVDTSAIIGLIIALIGGVTLGQIGQVKDQSNGQLTKMMELIREQSQTLARTPPVIEEPPPKEDAL